MRINYNGTAMLVNNYLANNDSALAVSLQKLSSGLKINSAKDNPSGLALAKRMNAQIKGVGQARMNASDGKNVIEVADGAMNEISDMLQRINELAVKAGNESMTDADRKTIQDEITQLVQEVDRITTSTEFNGQKLLDGSFALKGYTDNLDIKVDGYSDGAILGKYDFSYTVTDGEVSGGSIKNADGTVDVALDSSNTKIVGDYLTINDGAGFEVTFKIKDLADSTSASGSCTADLTGIGAMDLHIGANKDQTVSINISSMRADRLNLTRIDVTAPGGADKANAIVKDALAYTSSVRSKLGAYENRLESTMESLDVTSENMTASYSNIMDVDMAEEMTAYSSFQVITQAATSMLAQANDRPSQVLQLLQ